MSASVSGNDRVVFGTAAISAAEDPYHVLDAAFEKGVRRFDLARTYGLGKSETIFGEWMESRGINRNDIHIITKGGMGDDKYGDPNRPLLDRETLMGEIEASLNALKVEDVDMYMYHRDDPRMHVKNFVIWSNEIIESGRTAAWGVSNWSFERFQEAHNYAIENGLKPPTANSPQLSLAKPACEVWPTTFSVAGEEHEEQIQWYHENGVELVCWEVLAKGFMAVPDLWCEKTVDPSFFDKEVEIGTDEWRMQRIQRAYCNDENYRRRRNALKVAEEHNLSLAQIAALYAMSVSPNISVIMGFLEASQVDDVKDLHHYHFDKNCVIGDDEAIAKSFKLIDLRTLADDAAENVSSISSEKRTEVLAM
ncbi:hypothetical protein CTEN210_08034 [Chaetoceros tenuissimus]|uniref:NADP-dependent oxidoreductase domain-containing protein n=1 Tax=Chaetoceros tenuissimus TaxID=426638 RepID=A0AAD3H691_9STRA|nr:hypothetical protein CTEN210_08034 [Chaetoceros tenuissimus]